MHVSRKAAGKAKAVLECVGLDSSTITACIQANPLNDEEAVQDGLTRWIGGQGHRPSTWKVLIEAMEFAQIEKESVKCLRKKLAFRACNQGAVIL